jgi:hypothetical protein
MTDIDDVITALATRISTGMAGDALATRTYAYAVDSPTPPIAIVLPGEGDFVTQATFDGKDDYDLVVKVLVGTAVSRAAQAQLLGYLASTGSTSVKAAIYGDGTLGGIVSDLVVSTRTYGDVEYAGVVFYGADLAVTVYG